MQRRQRAIVIHSPYSGRSDRLPHALFSLEEKGVEIAGNLAISDLDNMPPQGSVWQQNGINIAITAGGDGLIGGVITHIAECGLPLGILPLGTSNDVARSLHIPQDISQAIDVIVRGRIQGIDIGVAKPAQQTPLAASSKQSNPVVTNTAPQKHGFFAHLMTVGMNVEFARIATNVVTRQHYGRLTYPFAALEVLKYHAALEVELHFEGLVVPARKRFVPGQMNVRAAIPAENIALHCHALQVSIINAPIFGGHWQLSIPGVKLGDRLLDIVVVEDIELGHLNTRLAQLFGQQEHKELPSIHRSKLREFHPAELTGIPGIHHLQAQGVTLSTNVDPQDVTLDGEVRGQTPINVQMADQRLQVVVPTEREIF